MSQDQQSALDWLKNEQPNIDQLKAATGAISRKLAQHPDLSPDDRRNLEGALKVVADELQAQEYALDDEELNTVDAPDNIDSSALGSSPVSDNSGNGLDTRPLGEENNGPIQQLHGDEKLAAIAALKQALKS